MILLDTHVILWLALDPKRISATAASSIRELAQDAARICISCASLYEISRLSARGRVTLDVAADRFLQRVAMRFSVLELSTSIAVAAGSFSDPFPGDPMDRIIAATALTEGIPLVTADERIRRSGVVRTIW